jgi:hypothetical protein
LVLLLFFLKYKHLKKKAYLNSYNCQLHLPSWHLMSLFRFMGASKELTERRQLGTENVKQRQRLALWHTHRPTVLMTPLFSNTDGSTN